MELIEELKKDAERILTPIGDKPIKGKTETKENSWSPAAALEETKEG